MKMKYSSALFALLVLMHVSHIKGATKPTKYPPKLGGGADGAAGSEFLKGTADTPKLEIRSHCTKSTPASTDVDMNLFVYQKDTAFKFSNIGPDDDKLVEYQACFLIDAKEYVDNKNIQKATTLTGCGGSASLVRGNSGGDIGTDLDSRTFKTKISFDPSDNSYDCGGYKNMDTKAVFAVTCKRYELYDKLFDYTFLVYYDADKDACTSLQIDPQDITVATPPTIDHAHQFEVTFKAYTNDDIAGVPWPNGPQSEDGSHSNNVKEVTGVLDLGTTFYLEICLINPSKPSDPSYKPFFNDGFEPIGIYVKKCTATNDKDTGTPGIDADTPVTFIEDGCGLGVDPMEMVGKSGLPNERGFMYVKDSTDSTLDWLRTPNCFRSFPTEAVSFARAIRDAVARTVYKCEIEYCFSSSDTKCFGTKTQERIGYPACARKKREANDTVTGFTRNTAGYPTEVSVAVSVSLPGSKQAHSNSCPESMMFVGISTILSVAFFVTVILSGVLMYNIRSVYFNSDDSSIIGIVN
ncbi:uncharacterized protein LOC132723513 isoform X2 [Ruditapes philippinarum]|uniref:uncharacterized protein LOC132723513 isoform X2 n=1 Tax=Ruditapes philippinarum TaxID=129788 RepID=UPI00295B403A|nr:uncharacterized protein LOC132723513 isoform X2 [Ruditapes philippinarum]